MYSYTTANHRVPARSANTIWGSTESPPPANAAKLLPHSAVQSA